MPELPDVTVYVEALARCIGARVLDAVRIASPFLVRTVDPPIRDLAGRRVAAIGRLGKRIVIGFEGDVHLVLHLMIAGPSIGASRVRGSPASISSRPSTSRTAP